MLVARVLLVFGYLAGSLSFCANASTSAIFAVAILTYVAGKSFARIVAHFARLLDVKGLDQRHGVILHSWMIALLGRN